MATEITRDPPAHDAMRILIVEDEGSLRALLSSVLVSSGYDVVAALEDGAAIEATIRQTTPDIVCLDYHLPGRDGLELLRVINETFPELDVLFMTGSEDGSLESKAANEGAAGFLRKPFSMSQIVSELNAVSDTRRRAHAGNASLAEKPVNPVAAIDATPSPSPSVIATVQAPPAAFNPRHVVVADDNGSIRFLLKGLLSGLGLNVVCLAGNGVAAVNAARTYQPGILCLDVEMPNLSGIEALPLIRKASPRTAVVMITASATREFVEKAAALGARGYIVKPIRPAYLEAFIRKLLV